MSYTDTDQGSTAYGWDVVDLLVQMRWDNPQIRENWRKVATVYDETLPDTVSNVPDESLEPSSPDSIGTLMLGNGDPISTFDHDPSFCWLGSLASEKTPLRQCSMDSDTTLENPMQDDSCFETQACILRNILNGGGLHRYGDFSRQGSLVSKPITTASKDPRVISRPQRSQLLFGSKSRVALGISDSTTRNSTIRGGVYRSSMKPSQMQGGSSGELHSLPTRPGFSVVHRRDRPPKKPAPSDRRTEPRPSDTYPSFRPIHPPPSSLPARPTTRLHSSTARPSRGVLNHVFLAPVTQPDYTSPRKPRRDPTIRTVQSFQTKQHDLDYRNPYRERRSMWSSYDDLVRSQVVASTGEQGNLVNFASRGKPQHHMFDRRWNERERTGGNRKTAFRE